MDAVREERQGWLVAVGGGGGRLEAVRAGRSADGRPLWSPPKRTSRRILAKDERSPVASAGRGGTKSRHETRRPWLRPADHRWLRFAKNEQGWLVAVGGGGGQLEAVRAGRSVGGRPTWSPPETTSRWILVEEERSRVAPL